jgi:hypothetical protein
MLLQSSWRALCAASWAYDTERSQAQHSLANTIFELSFCMATAEELACTVRGQLDVDEVRAGEVGRLLQLVSSTLGKMRDATGGGSRSFVASVAAVVPRVWRGSWSAAHWARCAMQQGGGGADDL